MVEKRILCSDRLRRIPKQFSWVDHRLVRDNHLCDLSHRSHALYLFLVTVSDAQGLSYYSDPAIERYVSLDPMMLSVSRAELCAAGLIAYSRPLYQVLSLDKKQSVPAPIVSEHHYRNDRSELTSIGDMLRQAIGGGR